MLCYIVLCSLCSPLIDSFDHPTKSISHVSNTLSFPASSRFLIGDFEFVSFFQQESWSRKSSSKLWKELSFEILSSQSFRVRLWVNWFLKLSLHWLNVGAEWVKKSSECRSSLVNCTCGDLLEKIRQLTLMVNFDSVPKSVHKMKFLYRI